jgi:uncharacterized phiE125 gp8 family phage protein
MPRYALTLVTPPVSEPIMLEDAKAFLRQDGEFDNDTILQLIRTARRHFDGKDAWFGRALVTQTWDLSLDEFVAPIDVPLPPLQSVMSISYVDPEGATQTVPPTDYLVDTQREPGRIVPAYGVTWPTARSGTPNAVTVRFVAGYGTHHQVPEDIKTWLKQAVAYLYEQREATSLPGGFFWSLANYKAAWGF